VFCFDALPEMVGYFFALNTMKSKIILRKVKESLEGKEIYFYIAA